MKKQIKKALLVGINHYQGGAEDLEGCIEDAESMAQILRYNYTPYGAKPEPNFECTLLKSSDEADKNITRIQLKKEIKKLFEDPDADVVLLYFSGHGYENSLGGYLITPDVEEYEEGVSFIEIMAHANHAKDKEVFIILDCCNSGNLGRMTIAENQLVELRKGVSIMTASNADQSALDTRKGGVFTKLVCNALQGGNADIFGQVTFFHVYRHVEKMLGAWEQRPTFKINTSNSVILRKSEPKLAYETFRKMIDYFPKVDYDFKLDPAFEPTENQSDSEKERIFSDLQKMANTNLVVPVGEEHMYYAAVRSKSCRLTPVGKQYWQLLKNELLTSNS